MNREEYEEKIDELLKSEEHKGFAKATARLYELFDEYVLEKFDNPDEAWVKLTAESLVSKETEKKQMELISS